MTSGFTFLKVGAYYQEIVKGAITSQPWSSMCTARGKNLAPDLISSSASRRCGSGSSHRLPPNFLSPPLTYRRLGALDINEELCADRILPVLSRIVAAISGYLADQGCNIVDSSQFDDLHTGQFFMRVSFISEAGANEGKLEKGFAPVAEKFGMTWNLHDAAKRMKVLLMVSRFGHCLNDLLYRLEDRALPIEIVGVVSNHFDYQKVVVNHDIPSTTSRSRRKTSRKPKPDHGSRRADRHRTHRARPLHAGLSDDMCKKMSGKIINIHHSFLPSFKGANPYKQAFERGVKLIGATAHYVTADSTKVRSSSRTLPASPIRSLRTIMSRSVETSKARCWRARSTPHPPPHLHQRQPHGRLPASPGSYASERMG